MTNRNFIRLLLFSFFIVLLFPAQRLSAQDQPVTASGKVLPKPDVFVVHKDVRRVIVDVTVRDSHGQLVRGLTAKDFAVLEDGRPQRVLAFEVNELNNPSIALPPDAPSMPPNIFINIPKTPEQGPLYVLLYDMVNTEVEDQMTARKQLLNFISSKPAGTRFVVFAHSDGLHLVQGFTDDKDLLYAALSSDKPKPHVPKVFLLSRNFNAGDPVPMISALTHICEFLNGLPGRKNLIWVSGRFPLALFPSEEYPVDVQRDIREEANEMMRAQVAVYPVNARGVVVNPEGALTGARPNGGSTSVPQSVDSRGGGGTGYDTNSLSNPNAGGVALAGQLQSKGDSLYRDYAQQDAIANATGGRAFYSDNDLKSALDEALVDGGNYYTLVYSPTNPKYDGSLRRISVSLGNHGYRLSYRRSYYADDTGIPQQHLKKNQPAQTPEDVERRKEERTMFASLQHGAPLMHELIFKARIHPLGPPGLATPEQMAKLAEQPAFSHGNHGSKALKPIQVQTYAIYYVLVASQIKPLRDKALPLEFAAMAFDADGKVVNGISEEAVKEDSSNPFARLQSAPPESWELSNQKLYRAMQELTVPTTATSVRIAVRDTSTDRVGSLEVPLPLPPEPEVRATTAVPGPAGAPEHVN